MYNEFIAKPKAIWAYEIVWLVHKKIPIVHTIAAYTV